MATKHVTLTLTPTEASVLLVAAGSVGDDLDYYGLSGPQKRAYPRLMQKVRDAFNASRR